MSGSVSTISSIAGMWSGGSSDQNGKKKPPKRKGSDGGLAMAVLEEEADLYGYLSMFMVHSDALYAEIKKAKHRLQSGELDLSQAAADCGGGSCANTEFLDLFEAELERVAKTITTQQEAQELSAKALLTNSDAILASDDEKTTEALKPLRAKADELSNMVLKLQRFIARNAEVLAQVGANADKEIGTTCMALLSRRFSLAPWKSANTAVVVVLSDIYEDLRNAEAKNKKKDSTWVAPSSFERSTTKYWIKEDRLMELLLSAVTEAPLLVYGRSGHLTNRRDVSRSEGDKLWDSLATPINSVYFDSPTMVMYRERIKRSEGAQLFRVRWYGKKPEGEELVFLELKTHHEKWINEKSVKERVNIQEKDMRVFLSSQNWSLDVAKRLVLAAEPKLEGEKLNKQVDLINRMHDVVIKNDLRPCVRSMYARAAFQSPESNALRLTLDRNVTLIDERKSPPGSWCLPDDAVITANMSARVPYPVFEIKLSDSEMPPIFQDLIDKGTLIEAPKFSKFLSGAAAFNASKIETMPYWAGEPEFEEMFSKSRPATTLTKSCRKLKALTRRVTQTGIEVERVSQLFNLEDTDLTDSEDEAEKPRAPSVKEDAPTQASSSAKADGLLGLRFRGVGGDKDKEKEKEIAPRRRARVEPKSYFANERTFIQWISASLLLVTVSVILLDFQSGNNVDSTAGIILLCCAVFIVFYAAFVYFRRLKLLEGGKPYGYVDHFGPMLLSAAVLLGVVMLLYYYIDATYNEDDTAPSSLKGPYVTAERGNCYQRPTNGISSLTYEPSGVLLDESKHKLIVPSVHRITALSAITPETPVEGLAVIPDADLEAITYVGDRVFALGEGQDLPFLFELAWQSDGSLTLLETWDLAGFPSGAAEGLAYVPSDNGGSLYVAGDNFNPVFPEAEQNRGMIKIFNVPTIDSPNTLEPEDALNSNLLNSGLSDSKIGELHYFEGVLYVLHDNARVVRAWDILSTGNLLYSTKLPRVEGGFSNQWEGMALQRNDGSFNIEAPSLRGSSTPEGLILHMALDTPPQVWSFKVTEAIDPVQGGPMKGSIVFPSCAGAV